MADECARRPRCERQAARKPFAILHHWHSASERPTNLRGLHEPSRIPLPNTAPEILPTIASVLRRCSPASAESNLVSAQVATQAAASWPQIPSGSPVPTVSHPYSRELPAS